jgi:cytochrome c oxidase subunit 2
MAVMGTIWFVLSLAGDLIFWFVMGPHVPPGDMTSAAVNDQFDFNVLLMAAWPVVAGVWTYMGFAVIVWRASRPGTPPGGPSARAHLGIQVGWIATTTVVVMAAFVFGTYYLIVPAGAGGGEGPNPIWTPAAKDPLQVQVIGQQWRWTYRYPSFGGFETPQLVLPDNTTIEFHVTSLDVVHDWWAYQLSIKADANPQQDNVAYTNTHQLGTFVVRCDELCGLWHGAMFNYGRVVPRARFEAWAKRTERRLAPNTKFLPPYALVYTPDANGADGGYYPDNVDPYSKVEHYGASRGAT